MPLKIYALFAGFTYYPSGGWDDFQESWLTLDQAKAAVVKNQEEARDKFNRWEWWHVVDLASGMKVFEGNSG